MRVRAARGAVLAVVVAVAATVVPVRPAWGAPRVRLAQLAAGPGQVLALPFRLSHLGARWQGSEDAVVEVRTATRPGRWGRWQRLHVAHDLGDERRGRRLSGLVRADGARFVEARASGGQARHLEVVAIDAVGGRRLKVRTGRAARAGVGQPPVTSRGEWGADESMRRAPPSYSPINRMVVHHTVTPNDDPDPASTVRAVYAYHVRSNGWDDIGYNFLIDASGRIYEGRWARVHGPGEQPTGESLDGQGVVGAHAEGDNHGSVGVALLGTFIGRQPSPAAMDALRRLLAWKADRHGIDPLGTTTWNRGRTLPTIAGHRDVGATACPGDDLYASLPSVRKGVAAAVDEARAAVTRGYWALARDGRVFAFGEARAPLGSGVAFLAAGAAAIAATPSGQGYWVLTSGGRVLPFGDAPFLGSPEVVGATGRGLAIVATPSGLGYWVLEGSGRVRAFGDAADLGSVTGVASPSPVVAMAASPSGRGYWVATGDGAVHGFGDARLAGSARGIRLQQPVVALAPKADGSGYWLVGRDGGVFAFGTARFAGSLPGQRVRANVVAARATASGRGYYLLADDGRVLPFGDARFHGAPSGLSPSGPAVDLALRP